MSKMIWRDDDPALQTKGDKLRQFIEVNELFKKYGVTHTIALITRDIEKNTELVDYIKANPIIDVQLHCVDHIDFTHAPIERVEWQLKTGADDIERVFGKRPTTWFPTWNKTTETVNKIAAKLSLKVSYKKISLDQYIRVNGHVAEDVINMHFWHYGDQINLEQALRIHNGLKPNK